MEGENFSQRLMYSLREFGQMIADTGRLKSYAKAIAAAVRPGDVVVEIGAGPGVFSLLACRAGARRVFAIETDISIQYARDLAAANGFSDRIEFFQSDSHTVILPERANVIVSDIRGVLPLMGRAIPSQEDARQRFLAPGGIMIPQQDTLKVAVAETEKSYARLTRPWQKPVAGMDLSPTLQSVLNRLENVFFSKKQILTQVLDWGILNYAGGASSRAGAQLEFCTTRKGTGHGVCLWFETNLLNGIGYSSAPGTKNTVYGQLFLPWLEPVELSEGETIYVELHADLIGQDYVWRWETTIPARPGHAEIHFQQSTFRGAIYASSSLRRRSLDYAPKLSEESQADLWMLQRMDGSASLQSIAEAAAERFPQLFASWQDAFQRVAHLSSEFSR